MKRFSFSILMAGMLLVSLLGSCKKDNTGDYKMVFKADLQQPNEGSKTSIQSDGSVLWTAGDAIEISNGSAHSTFNLFEGAGSQTASFGGDIVEADHYYAAYPASAASFGENKMVTFTLPSTQSIATSANDFDKNVSLMVAASDSKEFAFKNVFGILGLDMKSANGITHVSRFELTAKGNVNIWGSSCSVTLDDDGNFTWNGLQGGTNKITLTCDVNLTETAQTFYIMVPPVTMSSGFGLKIFNGDMEIYNLETSNSVTIASNLGAYFQHDGQPLVIEPVKPLYVFSVGAENQVLFSPGNLQYMPSTGTWRFAEHQYDFCVDMNNLTYWMQPTDGEWEQVDAATYHYWLYEYDGVLNDEYDGWYVEYDATSEYNASSSSWIDLFGWGTWGPGKTPYLTSISNSDYTWSGDFSGTISNNSATDWRTLTGGESGEWYYLFNSRTNAANLYGFGTVANVHGTIVLPDNFTDPNTNGGSGAFVPKSSEVGWDANIYTIENWASMEDAGAVFLPAAGWRAEKAGPIVSDPGDWGIYWSKTECNSTHANGFGIIEGTRLWLGEDEECERNIGGSVRLVRPVISQAIGGSDEPIGGDDPFGD